MSLEEFARSIEQAQRKARSAESAKPYLPASTPASSLGHRCVRRLTYLRVMPQEASAPSEELSSIFKEGREHEKRVRRELSELGHEVLEGEVQFRDDRLDFSGHVDGRLKTPWGKRVPLEIKSWSGDGPRNEEEWREDSGSLMFRYYAQVQLYMYLTGEPEAMLLVVNKLTGLWTIATAHLDYALVEVLLKRAEAVRDAVLAWRRADDKDAALPERLADRSECGGCPFRHKCLPEDAEVDPLMLANDDELAAQLERRDQLDAGRREFEALDERLKTRVKLTNVPRFACGNFLVTRKVQKNGIRVIVERIMKSEVV